MTLVGGDNMMVCGPQQADGVGSESTMRIMARELSSLARTPAYWLMMFCYSIGIGMVGGLFSTLGTVFGEHRVGGHADDDDEW
jgi:hypothetical protein